MTTLSDHERLTIERYKERYKKHGYSPKSLGWDKGKQTLRFEILTSFFEICGAKILDIGCGFGDFNQFATSVCGDRYSYLGIDLLDVFVEEGKHRYGRQNVEFVQGEFSRSKLPNDFDFAIASGLFNSTRDENDNYLAIEETIKKALSLVNVGVAFDFLSDKVDYRLENTFHNSPERILSIAYGFSRKVVLRNDYMPFEFTVIIGKDDSFDRRSTTFTRLLGQ